MRDVVDSPLVIPKSYTVGFRIGEEPGRGREEGDTAPLAFATPYGTDSAYEKRLETLRNWCRGHIYSRREEDQGKEPVEINVENVPTRGFRLTEFATRYSTDNKVFRIADPRGFTLEVYAANFTNMLLNDTVVNGVFAGEYVWARNKTSHYLVSTSDKLYEEAIAAEKMQEEWTHPTVGDELKTKSGMSGVYVGDFYRIYIDTRYGYSYEGKNNYYGGNPTYWFKVFRDKKPRPVLYEFNEHHPEWNEHWSREKLDKTLRKTGHDESKVVVPELGVGLARSDHALTVYFKTIEDLEAFYTDESKMEALKEQLKANYSESDGKLKFIEVTDDLKLYGRY